MEFGVNFVTLCRILSTLMISRKFVNIGFESLDLAMLHDACIQILEVWRPQDRLRAQGSPQFINGGAGQLKLALPCRLPVACIHVINKRVSGMSRLCTAYRERAFLLSIEKQH